MGKNLMLWWSAMILSIRSLFEKVIVLLLTREGSNDAEGGFERTWESELDDANRIEVICELCSEFAKASGRGTSAASRAGREMSRCREKEKKRKSHKIGRQTKL